MKGVICGVLVLTAMLMTGCTRVSAETSATVSEKEVIEIEVNKKEIKEVEKEDFDLGKKTYVTKSGVALPYNVRGIMSLPKVEGKKPLVLVVHGSHDNENINSDIYKGFSYLIDFLAERGYAAASLDVQPAYVWSYGDNDDNEKIRAMFPIFIEELKKSKFADRLDFENIVLIGHSRGGQTVLDIANENENIKGVISIAPTEPENLNNKWKDIETAIIVPEFDGDVISLDGYSIYNSLISDNERKSSVSLVLLNRANHNYFNSSLKDNDTRLLGDKDKLNTQLKKEEQQLFIKNFAADFLDSIFIIDSENKLLDFTSAEPSKMYGLDVKTRLWTSGQEVILDYNNASSIEKDNVKVNTLREDIFYKKDEIEGFILPLSGQENFDYENLISIEWENAGGFIEIPLNNISFNDKNSLTIDLALDPSNKLNIVDKNQEFIVRVTDEEGDISDVIINNKNSALEYVKGTIDFTEIEGKNYHFWTSYTPLSTIRIPISNFKDINLDKIDSLSLIFDKTESGAIMIKNININ